MYRAKESGGSELFWKLFFENYILQKKSPRKRNPGLGLKLLVLPARLLANGPRKRNPGLGLKHQFRHDKASVGPRKRNPGLGLKPMMPRSLAALCPRKRNPGLGLKLHNTIYRAPHKSSKEKPRTGSETYSSPSCHSPIVLERETQDWV